MWRKLVTCEVLLSTYEDMTMRIDFNVWLDTYSNVEQYCLYRSAEENGYNGRPIIDGVYIWRPELDEKPPNNLKLTLEWGDNNEESPVTQA